MQSSSSHAAFHQSVVSLPREHLAAIQHIINDALALQARAPRPPPPPYNYAIHNNNNNNTHSHDPSLWFKPRMDLYQSSSPSGARPLVTATFELPGLRKEDVHIDVLDNHMIVAGDRRHLPPASVVEQHSQDAEMKDEESADATRDVGPAASKDTGMAGVESGTSLSALQESSFEGYTVREIKRGRFKRVVPLPAGTKLEDVKASMHDGILTVTFPGSMRPIPHSVPVA